MTALASLLGVRKSYSREGETQGEDCGELGGTD